MRPDEQLFDAIQQDDIEKVRRILEAESERKSKGVKVSRRLNINSHEHVYSSTPLIMACYLLHTPIAALLLEHGADVQAHDDRGDTSLHVACLKNPSSINAQDGAGDTALHSASTWMDFELVKLLVKYKADPNIQNDYGDSPLHHLCEHGHYEAVVMLLEAGADDKIENRDGLTPRDVACREGHEKVMALFAELDAQELEVFVVPKERPTSRVRARL